MENYKTTERPLNGGIQKVYRFENNFGASVVRHNFSYGGENGLWELAVIKFTSDSDSDFRLIYDTYITSDVLGHLTDEDVLSTLTEIKSL